MKNKKRVMLHVRDHSLIILTLPLSDDTKKTRIWDCYTLEVAVFTCITC